MVANRGMATSLSRKRGDQEIQNTNIICLLDDQMDVIGSNNIKGVLALECWTGGWLSRSATGQKKKWNLP